MLNFNICRVCREKHFENNSKKFPYYDRKEFLKDVDKFLKEGRVFCHNREQPYLGALSIEDMPPKECSYLLEQTLRNQC